VEQLAGLFQLGRVARTQPLVDAQQCFFVAAGDVFGQGVEQQGAARLVHHLDLFQAGGTDLLGGILGDLVAAFDNHLSGPVAARWIDNVAHRPAALDFHGAASVHDGFFAGFIERAQQGGIFAVFGVHGPQERHHGELAALVDADHETFLAGDVQLDPTATFGDDAATVQFAVAAAFGGHHEIHAGAAVQLADHHAIGTVDDELAAAEHNGHLAQIDVFLDRLVFGQAQPQLERPPVGQAQLPAFIGLVARFAQLVGHIFQAQRLVVAFDGKDLAQHAFDAVVRIALLRRHFELQEPFVAAGLDFRQIGNRQMGAQASEATSLRGDDSALGGGSHRRLSSDSSREGLLPDIRRRSVRWGLPECENASHPNEEA